MFYFYLWIAFVLCLNLYVMIKQDRTLSRLHRLAKRQNNKIQELYKQIEERDNLLEDYRIKYNIQVDISDSPD